MSEKARLLREADGTFGELRRAVEGLTEDEMRRAWLGPWGVRELLIHASGWHRVMIPALGRIAHGEPAYPTGAYDDFDAWNARFVTEKVGVKCADVVTELDASHRAFMDAARAVAEEHFASGGAAHALFDGTGPAHYREHAAQIREWRRMPAS